MDRILFFDGVCIMCNRLIQFVLKHDKKRLYKFATLQGATAERLLPEAFRQDLTTVVLLDHDGIFKESDAILRLLASLGGVFSVFGIFKIVPRFIRDRVYRFIATHRYRWFGTTESCAFLSKEDRERILD